MHLSVSSILYQDAALYTVFYEYELYNSIIRNTFTSSDCHIWELYLWASICIQLNLNLNFLQIPPDSSFNLISHFTNCLYSTMPEKDSVGVLGPKSCKMLS